MHIVLVLLSVLAPGLSVSGHRVSDWGKSAWVWRALMFTVISS